jgi:hypothetical protein
MLVKVHELSDVAEMTSKFGGINHTDSHGISGIDRRRRQDGPQLLILPKQQAYRHSKHASTGRGIRQMRALVHTTYETRT